MIKFTVGIPVGPDPAHKRWLMEAIESVKTQTHPVDEILLIDDMAHLDPIPGTRIEKNPWLCGPTHSQNFCVALARNEHVLLMGSDDKIHPWCLEDCAKTMQRYPDPIGYYWLDVEYSTGMCQAVACGGAVVSKTLWRNCGGYHWRSTIGSNDSMLISVFMVHPEAGHLIHVESAKPPMWHRDHAESVSALGSPALQGPVFTVRKILAEEWRKPSWT